MLSPLSMMSAIGGLATVGIVVVGALSTQPAAPVAENTTVVVAAPPQDEATTTAALLQDMEIERHEVTSQTPIDLLDARHRWHDLESQVFTAPVIRRPNPDYRGTPGGTGEQRFSNHLKNYTQPRSMVARTRQYHELRQNARVKERDGGRRLSRSRIEPNRAAKFGAVVRDTVYKRSNDYRTTGSRSITLQKTLNKHLRGIRRQGT